MKEPDKPTLNRDTVLDAIRSYGAEGLSIDGIMKLTKLSYYDIQRATFSLHRSKRIRHERRSKYLYFYPA